MGGRSIAWINSRDRNLLGLRRDLLTAAAYGVDQFLFVYGDKPTSGGRTSELTVQAMIEETRSIPDEPTFAGVPEFRIGAVAGFGSLPSWKRAVDFLFLQVSYSVGAAVTWRERAGVEVPAYAGVMVLASGAMARRVASAIPDIDIPRQLVDRIDQDPDVGVEAACEQVLQLRDTGAFSGVHLIPVGRYREVTARLEGAL
jgi:methylenetetrahydrofolate reductase (NADPH)